MYNYLSEENIDRFIELALQEDIMDGDHSSLASVPAMAENKANLIIKSEGIIAGIALAERIFKKVDPGISIEILIGDGKKVYYGDIAFKVKGKAQSILSAERLVLNCMQRMSGIATYTTKLNQLIADTSTHLLDTRKTTPNFRIAEKWAVKIGGGQNHRFGLFDMVMLKDNHVDFAGGIEPAIRGTVAYLKEKKLNLKIEIETRNLGEVEEVLKVGMVDIIMLDNMSPEIMSEALEMINGDYITEASGGITEETIRKVAETGIDYISVGALTHSAPSLDMSLKAVS